MACMFWGPWWANNMVVDHCDQPGCSLCHQCGLQPQQRHDALFFFFFIRAYWGIGIKAEHILGEQNVTADPISPGNLSTLFQVSAQASPLPTTVPQSLHNLLVAKQPDWTLPTWVSLFRSCSEQVWQALPKKLTSQANGATQSFAPEQVLPHFQPKRQPSLPS